MLRRVQTVWAKIYRNFALCTPISCQMSLPLSTLSKKSKLRKRNTPSSDYQVKKSVKLLTAAQVLSAEKMNLNRNKVEDWEPLKSPLSCSSMKAWSSCRAALIWPFPQKVRKDPISTVPAGCSWRATTEEGLLKCLYLLKWQTCVETKPIEQLCQLVFLYIWAMEAMKHMDKYKEVL